MSNYAQRNPARHVDPQLDHGLRLALGLGVVLVLLLPMARGSSDWLGWMPLWLVGMPAIALWSLHRFRLPARRAIARANAHGALRRPRAGAQARRRAMPAAKRLPHAA